MGAEIINTGNEEIEYAKSRPRKAGGKKKREKRWKKGGRGEKGIWPISTS